MTSNITRKRIEKVNASMVAHVPAIKLIEIALYNPGNTRKYEKNTEPALPKNEKI
jgi:hypothetical protein